MEELRIPRCYNPDKFREVKSVVLYHLFDPSQDSYGQCLHIRQVQNETLGEEKRELKYMINEDETIKPKILKKGNRFYRSDPFVDKHDNLRVGDRMRHANSTINDKLSAILPKLLSIIENDSVSNGPSPK